MKTKPVLRAALCCLAVAFSACVCGEPCNPEIDDNCGDAGPSVIPPDFCDTPEDGLNDSANCVLPLACGPDAGRREYIQPPEDGGGADQDWYSAEFGALTARSLLRVSAGYAAPVTPVALTVTVLQSNAMMSLARKVDDHGAGAPKLIEMIFPYGQSNSKLLFLVSDKGGRSPEVFDVRNQYFISVCTQENPDVNEPNDSPDAGGTPITLAQSGAVLQGSNTGYLATDNDVDWFQFTAPANMPAARNIIYLHITTAAELTPPPPYRLSYTLYDPTGTSIAEGVTANAFLKVDLATAKLVKTPGTYKVAVRGYKQNPNDPTVVPGDLRQQYTVDVQIMADLDMEEPNDTMAEAAGRARMLGLGNTVTITGRISYVPDPEWFAIDLPPNPAHSTMYVRLTASQTAGRFPPLAGNRDRQLRILTPVAAAGALTGVARCSSDPGACPKGYDPGDQVQRDLVDRVCNLVPDSGVGHCLWLERNQNNDAMNFANLRNMQGTIPVPPHGGTERYWIVTGDDGNNWADDVDWTLTISTAADPDEARFAGGALAGSVNGQVNGVITHGYGRTIEYDLADCAARPQSCRGIRSPFDYDAVPSDVDTFSFTLPGGSDQAWGLSWEIDKVDGGSLPGELGINLAFCGMSLPDGGCGTLTSTAYQSGNFSPWYSDALPDRVIGWSRQDMGSYVRITAEANQCLCFRAAYTRFNMSLALVDRNYYGPLTYRVIQSTAAYSGIFPGDSGVPTPCGARQADGGIGTNPCGLP